MDCGKLKWMVIGELFFVRVVEESFLFVLVGWAFGILSLASAGWRKLDWRVGGVGRRVG